jgi:Protein of unknown function (DUF3105)
VAKTKTRTPPPPRRVQAPKPRTGKQTTVDERGARTLLYTLALSGVGILAAVLLAVFVFHVGGHGTKPKVPRIALAIGCTQKKYLILPGVHVPALNSTVNWNSFPPTSGPHYGIPAPWNFYSAGERINPRITLHNLEHGGIDIFYGNKVAASQIQALQSFWQSSPNALIVAPMPKLDANIHVPRPVPNFSHKIVLAAWTAAPYGSSRGAVTPGNGYMITCSHFNAQTFKSFRDAHRGKGPERFQVNLLTPGT